MFFLVYRTKGGLDLTTGVRLWGCSLQTKTTGMSEIKFFDLQFVSLPQLHPQLCIHFNILLKDIK